MEKTAKVQHTFKDEHTMRQKSFVMFMLYEFATMSVEQEFSAQNDNTKANSTLRQHQRKQRTTTTPMKPAQWRICRCGYSANDNMKSDC